MGKGRKILRRFVVLGLSIAMASTAVGTVAGPDSMAAAKPALAGKAIVKEKKTTSIAIKSNGFQIKKVTATSDKPAIATVKATVKAITIKGVKAGKTVITTSVNAVRNGSRKTFSFKTNVTVKANGVVTVNTEKELKKALSDKKTKTILIGKKAKNITIPKGDYSKVDLIVNAPKASITNNATFKSIDIQALAANTWTERAKNNSFIFNLLTPLHYIVDEGAEVASMLFNTAVEGASKLEIAGSVGTMTFQTTMTMSVTTTGLASVASLSVTAAVNLQLSTQGSSSVGTFVVAGKGATIDMTATENSTIGSISVKAEAAGSDSETGGQTKVDIKTDGQSKVDSITTEAADTPVTVTADGESTVSTVKVEGEGTASVGGTSENQTKIDLKDAGEGAKVTVTTTTVTVEAGEGTKTDSIVNNQSGQSIQTQVTKSDGTTETTVTPPTTGSDTKPGGTDPKTPTTPVTPATEPAQGGTDAGAGGGAGGGGGGGGATGGSGNNGGNSTGNNSGTQVIKASAIQLDRTLVQLAASGQSVALTAAVVPATANEQITWTVTDPTIAGIQVVDSRKVNIFGYRPGETMVKASVGNASAMVKVVVSNPVVHMIKAQQTKANGVCLSFDSDIRWTRFSIGNFKIHKLNGQEQVAETYAFNSLDLSEDGKQITLRVTTALVSGSKYRVDYTNGDIKDLCEFIAAGGAAVASIKVFDSEAEQDVHSKVECALYDSKGFDVTATFATGDTVTLELVNNTDGNECGRIGDEPGQHWIIMHDVGDTQTVKVTYDPKIEGFTPISATATITCVPRKNPAYFFYGNGGTIQDKEVFVMKSNDFGQMFQPFPYPDDREGYDFLGYSTDQDATTATITKREDIMIAEDTTLYAVWKQKSSGGSSSGGGWTTPSPQVIRASAIQLDRSGVQLAASGQSVTLTAEVVPTTANEHITWTITDPTIASFEVVNNRSINIFGNRLGKTTVKASVGDFSAMAAVVVCSPVAYVRMTEAQQTKANEVCLSFDSDITLNRFSLENFKLHKLDDQSQVAETYELTSLKLSEDGKKITSKVNTAMVSGSAYRVDYTNGDIRDSRMFIAAGGEVASIRILSSEAEKDVHSKVECALYDANGMDVTATFAIFTSAEIFTFELLGEDKGNECGRIGDEPGQHWIIMHDVGDTQTVKVTYDPKIEGFTPISATATITCVPRKNPAYFFYGNGGTIQDKEVFVMKSNDFGQMFQPFPYPDDREGYDFLGYSTDQDATTATITKREDIMIAEDTTLYAVWKLK